MIGKLSFRKEIAKGTVEVEFKLPQAIEFVAGQYVTITLPSLSHNDARGLSRDFSINNPPSQNDRIIITTRVRESAFKKTLLELPIGTEVEIDYPSGRFKLLDETTKPVVLMAGGIGVTPFLSMIRDANERKTNHQITLVYSNRDKESAAYLSELEEIEKNSRNFKLIPIMTQDPNWPGEKRRIDSQLIKDYFPEVNRQTYMIAGPPEMVEGVFKALTEAGVEPQNIKSEDFAGY